MFEARTDVSPCPVLTSARSHCRAVLLAAFILIADKEMVRACVKSL